MPQNDIRILIVEDEALMSNLLGSFFAEQQFRTDACTSGEEALVRLENEHYDLGSRTSTCPR